MAVLPQQGARSKKTKMKACSLIEPEEEKELVSFLLKRVGGKRDSSSYRG